MFHPHKFYNSFVPVFFFQSHLFTWKRQVLIWQLPFVVFWDLWCWPLVQQHLKKKCRLGRVGAKFRRSFLARKLRCGCCFCWMFGDHVRGSELLCPFLLRSQSKSTLILDIKQFYMIHCLPCSTCVITYNSYQYHLLLFFQNMFFCPSASNLPVSPNCRLFRCRIRRHVMLGLDEPWYSQMLCS